MKLNVYEKKKVVKTYTADSYKLLLGTVEDVTNAVNLDNMKTGSNAEIIGMAFNLVKNSYSTVVNLMKDIFDDITDEDLKKCAVDEIVTVIAEVITMTLVQLNIGFGKN